MHIPPPQWQPSHDGGTDQTNHERRAPVQPSLATHTAALRIKTGEYDCSNYTTQANLTARRVSWKPSSHARPTLHQPHRPEERAGVPSTNHADQKRGLECPPPTTQTRREGWSGGKQRSDEGSTTHGQQTRLRGSPRTAGPVVDGHAESTNKAEGAAHGQLDQPWMAMQGPQTRRKGQYRDSWISRGWPCRVWRAYDNGVNYGINDSVRQYHGPTADTSTSKHHTIPHMYAPKPSVHPNAKSDPAGDAAKARAISILGQRRRNTKRPMTTDKQAGQQRRARERGPI